MLISNIQHFKIILNSSYSRWIELSQKAFCPNPNNPKGKMIVSKFAHERFREGLIYIAFCGIYLEAILVILGRHKYGEKQYDDYFDKLT